VLGGKSLASAAPKGGRGGLLQAIAKGTKLKKAETVKKPSELQRGMADSLAMALSRRQLRASSLASEDGDSEDDDWDNDGDNGGGGGGWKKADRQSYHSYEEKEEEGDSFESCSSSDDEMGFGLFDDTEMSGVTLGKIKEQAGKTSGCYGGGLGADDEMIEMLRKLPEDPEFLEQIPLITSKDVLDVLIGTQKSDGSWSREDVGVLSIDPGKVEELLSSAGARSYGSKAFSSILSMVVTAVILYALEEYGESDASVSTAVTKARAYLKQMDKKYSSIYHHLELGSSWESAAAHVAKKCRSLGDIFSGI
jgi:hypothetical protein